jgi:hypothetical protein
MFHPKGFHSGRLGSYLKNTKWLKIMSNDKRCSLLVIASLISKTKDGFDNNAHVFEFSTVITFPLLINVVYICNDWKSMFFKLLLT